jgi:hypothetical protein
MSLADAAAWTGAIATLFGAIATLLAVIVALFKEELTRLWCRPQLDATIRPGRPRCQKTTIEFRNPLTGAVVVSAECYYLRLWVENKGNLQAKRVQVFASRLLRRQVDGTFQEVADFLPMNLCWTHAVKSDGRPEVFLDGLSPLIGQYCDIGRIIDPKNRIHFGDTLTGVSDQQTILALALEVAPNTKSHLCRPGVYRLEIRLAEANLRPVDRTLEITVQGEWHSDEDKMCADGVGVKIVV